MSSFWAFCFSVFTMFGVCKNVFALRENETHYLVVHMYICTYHLTYYSVSPYAYNDSWQSIYHDYESIDACCIRFWTVGGPFPPAAAPHASPNGLTDYTSTFSQTEPALSS